MIPTTCPECKATYEVKLKKYPSRGYPFEIDGEDRAKVIAEQIIGNAVPVKLAEFVASCVKEYISDIRKDSIVTENQLSLRFDNITKTITQIVWL
ncbi:MAG: hypothetical protein LBG19_05325 [Prevotellaceae bacterium]|jgi:hypothetical protein|nr:hypothetical protein [Prevotellaceae bacterium]